MLRQPVIHHGDCLVVLPTLAENSIDSCVTDPPYHLTSIVKRFAKSPRSENTENTENGRTGRGFMGKLWDGGDVAANPETWAAVYRVLKPGAHLVAFGGTRTYHRMVCAIEDAGFEIRDTIMWLYGSGFPKSHNQGNGWGTALKPACELICLARKPLSEGTVAANVLKWGTGAINVDGCRVEHTTVDGGSLATNPHLRQSINGGNGGTIFPTESNRRIVTPNQSGRWPANVIHDGSEEVVAGFPNVHGAGFARDAIRQCEPTGMFSRAGDGNRIGDEGGSAARFFYTAKADSDERIGSKHPTVKPLDLMQYLIRLVTPQKGTVVDPFAGSGTTGEAAWREGMGALLIEREAEYVADIQRRMELMMAGPDERNREIIKAAGKAQDHENLPLFGGEIE